MSYLCYPTYKASEVTWLPKVPTHWDVSPLKRITSFISRGDGPDYVDESPIQVINQACIQWNGLHLENVKYQAEADVSGWKGLLYPKDVLLNSTGTGTLGRVGLFDEQGTYIADGHVTIIRVDQAHTDPRYIKYTFTTSLYQGYVYSALVAGATNQIELSRERLRATPIIHPPLVEQQAIAAFLDHETTRIDGLIAKQQQMIALLQENRKALISHAVTHGLDPDVPLKNSGVEWLGMVPEHWVVTRFKFVAAKIVDCLHATPVYSDDGIFPAIRTADISPGIVHTDSARRILADEYERWIERLEPTEGDILYSREGERFGIAACVPQGVRLCISQRMMAFRMNVEHNSTFIMWLLNSLQVYVQAEQDIMGATSPHINISTIRNYALALPPR